VSSSFDFAAVGYYPAMHDDDCVGARSVDLAAVVSFTKF